MRICNVIGINTGIMEMVYAENLVVNSGTMEGMKEEL